MNFANGGLSPLAEPGKAGTFGDKPRAFAIIGIIGIIAVEAGLTTWPPRRLIGVSTR